MINFPGLKYICKFLCNVYVNIVFFNAITDVHKYNNYFPLQESLYGQQIIQQI